MKPRRIFIDWDGPVAAKVARYLLPESPGSKMIDLSDSLVVVPTAQAGRRLRGACAGTLQESGASIVGMRIVTPAFFTRPLPGCRIADPITEMAAWVSLLNEMDLEEFRGLFPVAPVYRNTDWAVANAKLLIRLREEVADGMLGIPDIASKNVIDPGESERWDNLEVLETRYLEKLRILDLVDSCAAKRQSAENPSLPDGIRRIVLAAVPDPSALAVRAMQKLSEKYDVEILIHAPEELAQSFDQCGRPLSGKWTEIPIPDEDHTLIVAAGPADQAERVLKYLSDARDQFSSSQIAIGVPDVAVTRLLQNRLSDIGLNAYDPTPVNLDKTSLYRLISVFIRLAVDDDIDAFKTLIHHPDVMQWLKSIDLKPVRLLEELDELLLDRLPATWRDLKTAISHRGNAGNGNETDNGPPPLLCRMIDAVDPLIEALARKSPDSIRAVLNTIYSHRRFDQSDPEDRLFLETAQAIDPALAELDAASARFPSLDPPACHRIFLERLSGLAVSPERGDAQFDLEGWLELHWNDAPLCMVTGMNEGSVPSVRIEDPFLPDSVRKPLGLRDDADRLARDGYLMRALVESRASSGRVVFMTGRTGLKGDPLKPSRLLFQCPDEILPARALRLFGDAEAFRSRPSRLTSTLLDCSPPPEIAAKPVSDTIRITSLKDYLSCPFRYYLKHVLGMREKNYGKIEPDHLDFGNLAHDVFQIVMQDQSMRKCANEGNIASSLIDSARAVYADRYGSRLTLPVRLSLDSTIRRLKIAAGVQAKHASEGWHTIEVEVPFSLPVNGCTLTGRIDRIDRNDTGRILIVDYKTSDSETGVAANHVHKLKKNDPAADFLVDTHPVYAWTDLQLPLYSFWKGGNTETPAVGVAYFKLAGSDDNVKIDTWSAESGSLPGFDDSLRHAALACAEKIVDRIRSRIFWPPAALPSRYGTQSGIDKLFGGDPESVIDTTSFRQFMEGLKNEKA